MITCPHCKDDSQIQILFSKKEMSVSIKWAGQPIEKVPAYCLCNTCGKTFTTLDEK